jgi:hypothetical protein
MSLLIDERAGVLDDFEDSVERVGAGGEDG